MEKTTLPSLVEKMKELEAQEKAAEDAGQEVPESAYWEKEICTKLLAGKIDAAAELRRGVEERIDALKMAITTTKDLLERLDNAFFEAVSMSETKRLDGLAWSAKLQKNSKGTVVFDDASKIPLEYKKLDVCVTSKFNATDTKEKRFWTSVILKKPVKEDELNSLSAEDQSKVGECMTEFLNKAEIEAALKRDPNSVPGARLVIGQHLRIVKGDSKGKLLEKKEST